LELVLRHPNDRDREELYELLARKQTLSDEQMKRRNHFWSGVILFRGEKWNAALAEFRQAYVPEVHDGPLEFYIRRTEQVRDGVPHLDWTVTGFDAGNLAR
jgi:hypothetical protein